MELPILSRLEDNTSLIFGKVRFDTQVEMSGKQLDVQAWGHRETSGLEIENCDLSA